MARIGIQNFSGMLPIKDPALVPDQCASYCNNAYLYSGTVQGFRQTSSVYALKAPGNTKAVYRIPNSDSVKPDFTNSIWLEFTDEFMSVLRAPQVEDQYKRYYFFPSTGTPYYAPLQNIQALGAAPDPSVPGCSYLLGVPAPTSALFVSASGGTSGSSEVRAYVYTWVTSFGEEGPPSPASTATGNQDGTWAVTIPPIPPNADNERSIANINIYRSLVDTSGNAAYTFVAQVTRGATNYSDSALATDISGNNTLPSLFDDPITGELVSYDPPPADLQGVVQMANGIMAGWSNEVELWFSYPYLPHAWPAAYALTVDAPIVGLGAVGSSLVVCTEGSPWMATGVSPNAITLGKIAAKDSCISRGGVVASGEGVYYPSPNGLILVNPLGTTNMTGQLLTKEQWVAANPYDFAAARYNMSYFAAVKRSTAVDGGLLTDRETPNTSFTYLGFPDTVQNVYQDELSNEVFLVTNTEILQWNPAPATSQEPFTWQTKEFRFPFAQQFVAGKVLFDVPDSVTIPTPTAATRNTSQTQTFNPASQYLLLYVYADERLVLVREIQQSGELFMIPSGFKASYWSVKMVGQVVVRDFEIATSVKELQLV